MPPGLAAGRASCASGLDLSLAPVGSGSALQVASSLACGTEGDWTAATPGEYTLAQAGLTGLKSIGLYDGLAYVPLPLHLPAAASRACIQLRRTPRRRHNFMLTAARPSGACLSLTCAAPHSTESHGTMARTRTALCLRFTLQRQ